MLYIRKNLTTLLLLAFSLAVFGSVFSTVSAQETNQATMTVEDRLLRLEKAVTNLEEYALLLHYNQIGSVAEFETRIGELERSFSFIVGEVVQLQPAGGTAAPTNQAAPAQQPAQPTQVQATQTTQPIQQTQSVQQSQPAQTTAAPSTPAPAAPSVPSASGSQEDLVYLQVGAYNDAASAAAARAEIEKLGYSVYEGPSGQTIRLFLGPFRQSDVDTMKLWLSQQGIDSFVVR